MDRGRFCVEADEVGVCFWEEDREHCFEGKEESVGDHANVHYPEGRHDLFDRIYLCHGYRYAFDGLLFHRHDHLCYCYRDWSGPLLSVARVPSSHIGLKAWSEVYIAHHRIHAHRSKNSYL